MAEFIASVIVLLIATSGVAWIAYWLGKHQERKRVLGLLRELSVREFSVPVHAVFDLVRKGK